VIIRKMFSMSGLNAMKGLASLVVSSLVASAVPPDQFGLVAFGIPLVALLTLLTDLGLASAIIRDPDMDRSKAGAAVFFVATMAILAAVALAASSGLIERASRLPGLAPLLHGFSVVTVLWIYATAPRALLERQLAYERISAIEGSAMLCAVAAFGVSIKVGMGIFSLVIYHMVVQAVRAAALSISARRLFDLNHHVGQIASVMRVGAWLFATNLLSYAARNGGTLLVGALLGAGALGLYGLATQFMTVP
jgi:O-antigen/teichoic acid export membrane protein